MNSTARPFWLIVELWNWQIHWGFVRFLFFHKLPNSNFSFLIGTLACCQNKRKMNTIRVMKICAVRMTTLELHTSNKHVSLKYDTKHISEQNYAELTDCVSRVNTSKDDSFFLSLVITSNSNNCTSKELAKVKFSHDLDCSTISGNFQVRSVSVKAAPACPSYNPLKLYWGGGICRWAFGGDSTTTTTMTSAWLLQAAQLSAAQPQKRNWESSREED